MLGEKEDLILSVCLQWKAGAGHELADMDDLLLCLLALLAGLVCPRVRASLGLIVEMESMDAEAVQL